MRNCPLCLHDKSVPYSYKTYVTCVKCQHTYQPDPPAKTYQNPEEHNYNGAANAVMDQREKSINSYLALWLTKVVKPDSMLDIGCAYPYFASCFKRYGVKSIGLDGIYKDGRTHDLDVETLGVNWEDLDDGGYDTWRGVKLITMVHVLEHFKDPLTCIKRAYDNLSDDGVLYVRAPNKDVSGIERDHTDGHILIHPNIFGNESIVYAMQTCGFYLHWVEHMHNSGQSSWIFKKHKPRISLFMIVKNESSKIIKCLNSVKDYVDEMIVLDTGSTDNTIELATSIGAKVFKSKNFNENTTFKEFNFARARNESSNYASGDWLFWMDADDTFNCTSLKLDPNYDLFYITVKYGNTLLNHPRIYRNNWGMFFKGAIHEYLVADLARKQTLTNCFITHDTEDKPNRIERNIAILESEHQLNPKDKRTKFYLANAYRESRKYDDAIKLYHEYIDDGGNFNDELILAHYYCALCYYYKNNIADAIKILFKALIIDDRWGEIYCLLGQCYFNKNMLHNAIGYFKLALNMPYPVTHMFVNKSDYNETPKLWLSYCYEKLGDIETAKDYAKDNENRYRSLLNKKFTIEVCRLGALGDVLMTTPAVHELRKKYPNAHIRYVTHKNSMQMLIGNTDIDEVTETNGNCDRKISFTYPMHDGYPEVPLGKHLVEYFAENADVKLSDDWKNVLNLNNGDKVVLECSKPVISFAVKTGWSCYKEWPLEYWSELIKLFPEYHWIQIGAAGEPKIEGAQYTCGSLTLRESFSVMQNSVLFVGLDSVFNHASNALNVPSVILFGSTSPIGSGYKNNINLWSNYACSPCYIENNDISVHPKALCPYSQKCMKEYMKVELVADAIRKKLTVK